MLNSDSQLDPASVHLPESTEECHALITALRKEILRLLSITDSVKSLEQRIAELEKQVKTRNRMLFGKKSARVSASSLTGTGKQIYENCSEELEEEKSHLNPVPEDDNKQGGGGRTATKSLNNPRPIEHEITDAQKLACPDCGKLRHKIGFEASFSIDVLDTVYELLKHVQFKYACTDCEGHVVLAEKPEQPIAKGYAGPGLLAHIGRSKFDWHLPLYRQERIARAQGIQIGRSSMCRMLKHGADLLELIVKRMHELMLQSRIILSDGTTMPVIKKGLGKTHAAFLRIYRDETYITYGFSDTKSGEFPEEVLKGYKGVLLTDGEAAYNGVIRGGATKAGCSAHAFRKFEDARKEDPDQADIALGLFKALFEIERFAADFSEDERKALRDKMSKPLLQELKDWLDEQVIIPSTYMGDAITYCLNQWKALSYYAETGFVPMHNNDSENGIRPAVLGRRNWLFAGSMEGGKTAAIWMSIVQTCRRHGIDPFVYLRDVFTRLPSTSTSQIDQFLPDIWKRNQNASH